MTVTLTDNDWPFGRVIDLGDRIPGIFAMVAEDQ
jgi:hypothetical protein